MVIREFPWDASTSVANLTDSQLVQLCSLIENTTSEVLSSVVQEDSFTPTSSTYSLSQPERPSTFIIWTVGLMFVTVINMCAVVGIGVMRYLSKNVYNQVITLFVGLGVGSLSGSSFYHLLPQAHPSLMAAVDENGHPKHDYLHMAHFSLLGVYMFFMCDKVIKIVLETRKRNRLANIPNESASDMNTTHSDAQLLNSVENGLEDEKQKINNAEAAEMEMIKLVGNADKSMGDQLLPPPPSMASSICKRSIFFRIPAYFRSSKPSGSAHGICVHDHSMTLQAGDSAIAAVAWMIIFGDGFHNFIDGISIGASFAESLHSGVSVSLAVLAEEFPHELGDVAILVASGLTLRQALLYNLLSALTCYVGFGIGVGIGELGPEVSKYAFALAGGMFLYISLGCMMPEMKKAMEEALNVSLRSGLYVLLLQSIGLFSGLYLMYFMARYGEEISI